MLLLSCEEDFVQHPRVLLATLRFQEHPHWSLQVLHAAMFQVLRGAHILLRVLSTTENQEAQELLDEIQQPGACVRSGPVLAITNVGTASEFLVDGWSTEFVCRQQGQNKKPMGRSAQNTHYAPTYKTR